MSESANSEQERRKSFRIDMQKERVDIVWTDNKGIEHEKEIVCIDFSRGGVKVDCDEPIDLQLSATIIFKEASPNYQKLYGRIIRCIKQVNGCFEIALRFEESSRMNQLA